jgi:hypothetical protein
MVSREIWINMHYCTREFFQDLKYFEVFEKLTRACYIQIALETMRVGKGIFVSREWSIFVRVKCEMLDFSVVKCDLFCGREA